jgi:hypothetical protein
LGGVEVSIPGLSIGVGGSYYGEWFRYFTGSKSSSSFDLKSLPGGYCICQALRYNIKKSKGQDVLLLLQKMIRGVE